MPRAIKDASLDSRAARSRLKARHKPYYRLLQSGLHLGYRKLSSGPGNWLVRQYQGKGTYRLRNIGPADDYSDADGHSVFNFGQAQARAREEAAAKRGPYTVAQALDAYFASLEADGRSPRSIDNARIKAAALILPSLGSTPVSDLTAPMLRKWRDTLAVTPARVRAAVGEKPRHRPINGEDGKRARRATVNRVWATLRAALNLAFRDSLAPSDAEWRKVKGFAKVDHARTRFLSIEECQRLVNASAADFRPLVEAALQTGARYSELARLRVADFNPDAGTVHIRQSKSGHPRHIILTDEGVDLFRRLTAGQSGDAPILRKANGRPWGHADQRTPMLNAVRNARITPPISFHGLRHSWASHATMGGVPLTIVAASLGHSTTAMVEKHYGHLSQNYVADAIRAGAPRFGLTPSNVKSIRA